MVFTSSTGVFQGFGARVPIHQDHIGFVCGRRFATLSDIGRGTHTRVVVTNDTEAPFKMVTIGGRSVQDVSAAYTRLMQVAREAEARTPRVADMPSSMTALNIMPLQGIEHRVEIQKEDVGMVLGAKGATLRKLGNDTWTWVKFFKATDKSPATFSIRGFLQEDVGKAVTRMLSIAQESFNRRTGGARHFRQPRAQEPITMGDKAAFHMAPVPKSRKVSFKLASSSAPTSPSYAPQSPCYTPTIPHTPPSA